MVKHGHAAGAAAGSIPRLGFHPADDRVPGFEITDLATLYSRSRRRDPGGLHRLDFHTLTLVTEGRGAHMVDFVSHACRPGTLLWVRPGQVQRFDPDGALNGPHLLLTTAFPARFGGADRLVDQWYGPVCWQLGTGADFAALSALMGQIRAEFDRSGNCSPDILRLQLTVLLLQIDRLPRPGEQPDPRRGGELYARFRAELEHRYASTRRAEDYARRLGCTVKTLTRACSSVTGQPVKQVIDARVALEAQRLLAYTDETVSAIARRLGFSEPTNFGKFFARQCGVTPGDFRGGYHVPL